MTRTIRVWKHGDAYWILYTPRAGLMSASKTEGIATLRRELNLPATIGVVEMNGSPQPFWR